MDKKKKKHHNASPEAAHDPTDAGLPQTMMIMMMMCAMMALARKDKENALRWTQAGTFDIYVA
jgi:hypothetical protein